MSTVQIYLDDGRVFEYEVSDPNKGREHASAIINSGYRFKSSCQRNRIF